MTVATPDGRALVEDDLSLLVEDCALGADRSSRGDRVPSGYTAGADLRRAEEGAFVLPLDTSPAVALRAIAIAWLDPLPFDDPALRTDYAAALADRVATSQGVAVSPRFGRWVIAMTALASVSDADITATVLTSLEGGVTAYGGTDDTFVAEVIDWRLFTDVYEVLGGIESTSDAMRLSADDDQRTELDHRAEALEAYRALEMRAAPWSLPPLLRDAMATWRFDDVADPGGGLGLGRGSRRDGRGGGDGRTRDRPACSGTLRDGLHLDGPTRARYEAQREALDHVAEALRLDTGDRGLLSTLGMAGRDADAQLARMQDSGSRVRSRKRQRRPTT